MSNIDRIIKKALLEAADHPGLAAAMKAHKESGTQNKAAYSEHTKKMANYAKMDASDKDFKEPKRTVKDGDEKDFVDDYRGKNNLDLELDNPDAEYSERAKEGLKGSSRMGNKPTPDYEWEGVSDSGKLADKIIRTTGRRTKNTEKMPRYKKETSPVINKQTKKEMNPTITENTNTKPKMKRLRYKKELRDQKHALSLIPEHYKVDGNKFQITDGNNTLEVKWEGDNSGAGLVTNFANPTKLNENMERMKKLFNYKSSDFYGTKKSVVESSEKVFGTMLESVKHKTLISEQDGGEIPTMVGRSLKFGNIGIEFTNFSGSKGQNRTDGQLTVGTTKLPFNSQRLVDGSELGNVLKSEGVAIGANNKPKAISDLYDYLTNVAKVNVGDKTMFSTKLSATVSDTPGV